MEEIDDTESGVSLSIFPLFLLDRDTESASNAIYHWLLFKFMLGTPLESLEPDVQLYLRQMEDLKKAQPAKITSTFLQLVWNLMRQDNFDDPTRFYGSALTKEQYDVARTKPLWNGCVCFFHGALLTFFGQHIRKADFLVQNGHDYLAKSYAAFACIMLDTYLNGVSCFAAARETGKRHYAKLGEICRSKIKKWIRKGNPNVKHYEALLDAEAMAWQGKHSAAVKHFEVAILLSGRGGYQHDLAFASERFGEFQLSVLKDHDEGVYRLREAARYWRSWGAYAKVELLEQRNAVVFGLQKSTDIIGLNISVSSRRLDSLRSLS